MNKLSQSLSKKNINGVKWYYGQLLDGKYVWIKSTDLVKEKLNMHILE